MVADTSASRDGDACAGSGYRGVAGGRNGRGTRPRPSNSGEVGGEVRHQGEHVAVAAERMLPCAGRAVLRADAHQCRARGAVVLLRDRGPGSGMEEDEIDERCAGAPGRSLVMSDRIERALALEAVAFSSVGGLPAGVDACDLAGALMMAGRGAGPAVFRDACRTRCRMRPATAGAGGSWSPRLRISRDGALRQGE